jgi:Fur family zinc uptake transcriptional regulator
MMIVAKRTPKYVAKARSLIESSANKPTVKRCNVLAVLLSTTKPLSAYELTDRYNKRYTESIIAASVYRILDWLTQAGVAYRLNILNKFIACQQRPSTQQLSIFIVCKNCQKTIQKRAPNTLVHPIYERISEANYSDILPHIELTGVCEQCAHISHQKENVIE